MSSGTGLPTPPPSGDSDRAPEEQASGELGRWPPHDLPSATELLDAVRGFLETDVIPGTEGRLRFHARVAANVLAMVGRELALGPALARAHAERLRGLGVGDDAQLAAAIRSGALDDRLAEVRDAVRATVADKLAVANPGYLGPAQRD